MYYVILSFWLNPCFHRSTTKSKKRDSIPPVFLMESYRVTGISNNGQQQVCSQQSRSSRPIGNGAGTYGLSIRVQGIDGHPYVVLNNQDKGSYVDPNTNGYIDTDGSFIENYQDYDFRGAKEAGSTSPFRQYRSQTMLQYSNSQNGLLDSQGNKSSALLNFQKHPELLHPYDPETNALNIESFRSLPTRPSLKAETGNIHQSSFSKSSLPTTSLPRSSSVDQYKASSQQDKKHILMPSKNDNVLPKPRSQPHLTPQAEPSQPEARPQPQTAQPQSRPRLTNPNLHQSMPSSKPVHQSGPPVLPRCSTVSSPISDKSKTSCRSPTSVSSANSSLERAHHDPDVLPLRRSDSSGPVLQSVSRSRHSSSSSTSKTAEEMDSLYLDAINRHDNRRYIPFSPGSGRDIDTGSIPGVDELIEKFDGKDGSHHHRGRTGRRNRINPEDRKRSRSVDSGLGLRNVSGDMGSLSRRQGTSVEHVLRPSQLRLQKNVGSQDSWIMTVDGKMNSRPSSHVTSAPTSPHSTIAKGVSSIQGYRNPQNTSSLPFKSKESEDSASAVGKILVTTTTTSLSKRSSTTGQKSSGEADVQVKYVFGPIVNYIYFIKLFDNT